MDSSLLTLPGLDTRLARALLNSRRVDYATLHSILEQVREERLVRPHTLALELQARGVVSGSDLESELGRLVGGSAPRAWGAGTRVDGYVVLRELGVGGMGAVVLARDERTGGEVAIKTIELGEDPELLTRFEREAEAQARVDRHPNVVRIHRVGQGGGRRYLVMDAVSGGDLEARLRQGPLEPEVAARVVRDLADGLRHTHACGVLHRDLKPANVLFDEAGVPKLTDFGLARLLDVEGLTRTGEVLGTPAYMAPEQAYGTAPDERTDVYGLGGVLFAALTGRPPFSGATAIALLAEVVSTPAPTVCVERPGVPVSLSKICARCLEKDPAKRYASAAALRDALDEFLSGDAPPASARAPWLVGVACAAVAIVALAGAWRSTERPRPEVGQSPPERPVAVLPPLETNGEATSAPVMRAQRAEALLVASGTPAEEVAAARDALQKPIFERHDPDVGPLVAVAELSSQTFVGSSYEHTHLYEAQTGERLHTWAGPLGAVSPDRRTLALLRPAKVVLVDTLTREELESWEVRNPESASFVDDESLVLAYASAAKGDSETRQVALLKRTSAELIPYRLRLNVKHVLALPAGQGFLLSTRRHHSLPRTVRLFTLAEEESWSWPHESPLSSLSLDPQGRLAMGFSSGEAYVLQPGPQAAPVLLKNPVVGYGGRAHERGVERIAWVDSDLLVTLQAARPMGDSRGDQGKRHLTVWRLEAGTWRVERDLIGVGLDPRAFFVSGDRRRVVLASDTARVLCFPFSGWVPRFARTEPYFTQRAPRRAFAVWAYARRCADEGASAQTTSGTYDHLLTLKLTPAHRAMAERERARFGAGGVDLSATGFEAKRHLSLKRPFDAGSYLSLARAYLGLGDVVFARRFIELATVHLETRSRNQARELKQLQGELERAEAAAPTDWDPERR